MGGYELRDDMSYSEWADNEDLKVIFEDIYEIKEAVKAFVESQVFERQQQLDMATLNDPHFQKMFKWAQDDLDIHSCRELRQKVRGVLMEMRRRMMNCPIAKRLKK